MLWEWTIGHPEAVEEAFPELERIEKRHGATAGEKYTEGFEGGFTSWAICDGELVCLAIMA